MSYKKNLCVYMSYKKKSCVYMSFNIKRHIYTSVISWWLTSFRVLWFERAGKGIPPSSWPDFWNTVCCINPVRFHPAPLARSSDRLIKPAFLRSRYVIERSRTPSVWNKQRRAKKKVKMRMLASLKGSRGILGEWSPCLSRQIWMVAWVRDHRWRGGPDWHRCVLRGLKLSLKPEFRLNVTWANPVIWRPVLTYPGRKGRLGCLPNPGVCLLQ